MRSSFAECFEYFIGVLFDIYFAEYLRDPALLVDQKCRPLNAHILFPVHRFFHPDAIFLDYVLFCIGQKVERKIVFRSKFLVLLLAVGRNTEQLDFLLVEDVVRVTERTGLERSARRVVFRVEKQHNTLALKIRKLHRISVLIIAFEVRCFIAFFEHRFTKIVILRIVANAEART